MKIKKQVDWIDGSDRQFSVADCVVRAIRKEENALEFIFEEGIWVKVDSNFERTHQWTALKSARFLNDRFRQARMSL